MVEAGRAKVGEGRRERGAIPLHLGYYRRLSSGGFKGGGEAVRRPSPIGSKKFNKPLFPV